MAPGLCVCFAMNTKAEPGVCLKASLWRNGALKVNKQPFPLFRQLNGSLRKLHEYFSRTIGAAGNNHRVAPAKQTTRSDMKRNAVKVPLGAKNFVIPLRPCL
jgi:hypothetical protein